jgi:sentrin-specific protease 1
MSSNQNIVTKYAITIKPSDIRTLHGSSWLNDEIINFYGELIMTRANENTELYPKIHVFNTFFYEKLKGGYQGVRRWSKKVHHCLNLV